MKKPDHIDLKPEELDALIQRVKESSLSEDDCKIIEALVATIIALGKAVDDKKASIKKLLKMIFGPSSEKSSKILNDPDEQSEPDEANGSEETKTEDESAPEPKAAPEAKPKKQKGHGRKKASDYKGLDIIPVKHQDIKHGDTCPGCEIGKTYECQEPGIAIRLFGTPPIDGKIYNMQKLRCNACGEVFTAPLPEEAGDKKYDETAGSMIAFLKYGNGVPFYRQEQLQNCLGIPMASSTQWDLIEKTADLVYPVFNELIRQGAQGHLVHNDDTVMKVLDLIKLNATGENGARSGMFTTGILSENGDLKIALFFTGSNHAGENLEQVLLNRANGLDPPIQMCDALTRNLPATCQTILCNCLAHGRRKFVDVLSAFPDECAYVIEILAKVYNNDAFAKGKGMSPELRLILHQEESGPLMDDLEQWFHEQLEQKKIEPNSSIGKACSYMIKHWAELTMFLKIAGAPLDNNLCEQILKRAIMHRKNSLFYKTEHGAYIGDLFMSLIHTCQFNNVNPFNYITDLQRHSSEVFKNPQAWMPWNYQANLNS